MEDSAPKIQYQPVVPAPPEENPEPSETPHQVVTVSKKEKLRKLIKKPVFMASAAAIVLLLGAGTTFALMQDKKPATVATIQSQKQVAQLGVAVTVVDGTATYKTGKAEWKKLTVDTDLKKGDSVKTDAGGRAVLTLDDGSALRLNESSSVVLTSLDAKAVRITQASGTAYSRVVASDRTYTVVVADTDYTALGTAFTTMNTEASKGVQVMHSKVKVENVKEAVSEGKQYYTTNQNVALDDKTTDLNYDEINGSAFMMWNLEQDEKDQKFKDKLGAWAKVKEQKIAAAAAAAAKPAESGTAIKLSANNSSRGTVLTWTITGVTAPDGFKVVRSKKSANPTFGKDDAVYISNGAERSYTWKGDNSNEEYWYRVCTYRPDTGAGCDNYSNTVKIKSVFIEAEKVTRGTMTLTDNGGLSWAYTGKAIYGYKINAATTANPSYGGEGVKSIYTSDTSISTAGINDLPSGTYYVRICAYTSGSESDPCVDYSNQVTFVKP